MADGRETRDDSVHLLGRRGPLCGAPYLVLTKTVTDASRATCEGCAATLARRRDDVRLRCPDCGSSDVECTYSMFRNARTHNHRCNGCGLSQTWKVATR